MHSLQQLLGVTGNLFCSTSFFCRFYSRYWWLYIPGMIPLQSWHLVRTGPTWLFIIIYFYSCRASVHLIPHDSKYHVHGLQCGHAVGSTFSIVPRLFECRGAYKFTICRILLSLLNVYLWTTLQYLLIRGVHGVQYSTCIAIRAYDHRL